MRGNLPEKLVIIILQVAIFLLVLLGALPITIFEVSPVTILFEAIIFYWSVYYQSVIPPLYLYSLGVVQDSLFGSIFGSNPLSNLLSQYIISHQARLFIRQPFIVVWFSYAIYVIGINLFKLMFFAFFSGKIIFGRMIIMHCLLSICVYPLLHIVFSKIYLMLPQTRDNA